MAESFQVSVDGDTWRDQYEAAYDVAELFFGHRVFLLESSKSWASTRNGSFEFVSHKHDGLVFTKTCCQTAVSAPHHHHCEQRTGR